MIINSKKMMDKNELIELAAESFARILIQQIMNKNNDKIKNKYGKPNN